jgi:hypothetical protein
MRPASTAPGAASPASESQQLEGRAGRPLDERRGGVDADRDIRLIHRSLVGDVVELPDCQRPRRESEHPTRERKRHRRVTTLHVMHPVEPCGGRRRGVVGG